jgi:hypothetical protein
MNLSFTSIFIGEFILKQLGLSPIGYIKDPVNCFDGVIVLVSVIDICIII